MVANKIRKKVIFLVFLSLFICAQLIADYIIPCNYPVYDFISIVQDFGCLDDINAICPESKDEIINKLKNIISSNISKSYKKIAKYHFNRLSINEKQGITSSIYPIKKIPDTFISIFQQQLPSKKLVAYKNDGVDIFLSGILGMDYGLCKSENDSKYRLLKYYGLEFGGVFSKTISFYSSFRKGHYEGDPFFTRTDSVQLSAGWDYPEKIDIQTECSLITDIINAAIGYGNFQIGNSITNSIIFTKNISSVPYIKLSKRFGEFSYVSLYSQLVPDSVGNEDECRTKSFALQMISYSTDKFLIAIGENALYEDRNFDISYSTPLIMYKLVDFQNRQRDNVNAFLITNYIPFCGFMIYNNLFIDDVKLSRLTTDEYLSGFAEQLGLLYSLKDIPINIAFEGTAIGPRTYYHRRRLTYSHRDQLLGFQEGSNLLDLAFRIQYLMPGFECSILYENIQQGSISNNPFAKIQTNEKFLAGSISRIQTLSTSINYSITPHINLHVNYVSENKDNSTKHYLYSGVELKY